MRGGDESLLGSSSSTSLNGLLRVGGLEMFKLLERTGLSLMWEF